MKLAPIRCYNEVGFYGQIIDTIPRSINNTGRKAYVIAQRERETLL
jgi:hypothetical protein